MQMQGWECGSFDDLYQFMLSANINHTYSNTSRTCETNWNERKASWVGERKTWLGPIWKIWLIPSTGIVLANVEQKPQRGKKKIQKQWPYSHVVEISFYLYQVKVIHYLHWVKKELMVFSDCPTYITSTNQNIKIIPKLLKIRPI